nr:IS110 family transposase [Faecalibacterium prausnitzii]
MSYCPVAGIDVSKRFSDMCILSPDNKIFAQEKIYHDETSINRANALLQKAERLFFSKPVIVMESTSHYHLILFQFFSEHGYDVIVVNPLQSNSMKDFSIRKRKTDRVDAFKLAMMHKLVFIIFAVLRDQKPFELKTPEQHAVEQGFVKAA